ncbi:hypothetical protein JKP88DRAFT_24622 [Tribonema minus]|uniref:Uncharacterized protein n=1 Tax=Tribonema minus TaxID=303371 RepID=A0A835Z818_9STRA|nr:hypothetical protein JKP88DRAFT_24622 [Tribonema minus]
MEMGACSNRGRGGNGRGRRRQHNSAQQHRSVTAQAPPSTGVMRRSSRLAGKRVSFCLADASDSEEDDTSDSAFEDEAADAEAAAATSMTTSTGNAPVKSEANAVDFAATASTAAANGSDAKAAASYGGYVTDDLTDTSFESEAEDVAMDELFRSFDFQALDTAAMDLPSLEVCGGGSSAGDGGSGALDNLDVLSYLDSMIPAVSPCLVLEDMA